MVSRPTDSVVCGALQGGLRSRRGQQEVRTIEKVDDGTRGLQWDGKRQLSSVQAKRFNVRC